MTDEPKVVHGTSVEKLHCRFGSAGERFLYSRPDESAWWIVTIRCSDEGNHRITASLLPFVGKELARLAARVDELEQVEEYVTTLNEGMTEEHDKAAELEAENERLRDVLEAIRDYEPTEICKDEFAYDRMVDGFHVAAKAALAAKEPSG